MRTVQVGESKRRHYQEIVLLTQPISKIGRNDAVGIVTLFVKAISCRETQPEPFGRTIMIVKREYRCV